MRATKTLAHRWERIGADSVETASAVDWQQYIGIKDLPPGPEYYDFRVDKTLAALAENLADNG